MCQTIRILIYDYLSGPIRISRFWAIETSLRSPPMHRPYPLALLTRYLRGDGWLNPEPLG